MPKTNYYAEHVRDVYSRTPKAVFAAIAVSALTCGGDHLEAAEQRVVDEWWSLYRNGIVPQRPPFPESSESAASWASAQQAEPTIVTS